MAAELGFEPRQHESESWVLPLHNSAVCQPNTTCPTDYIIIVFLRQNVNRSIKLYLIFTFLRSILPELFRKASAEVQQRQTEGEAGGGFSERNRTRRR